MPTEARAFISTAIPAPRHRASTLVLAAIALAYGAIAPFSSLPLPRSPDYVSSLQGMMGVAYLLTAVLLYGQFSILRSGALLVLASGYLFTALVIVLRVSTIPGVVSSAVSPLPALPQDRPWLFIIWHIGLAVAVFAYVILRDAERGKTAIRIRTAKAIGLSVLAVAIMVLIIAGGVRAGRYSLPELVFHESRISPLGRHVTGIALLIVLSTMALLEVRRTSILDRWLAVSLGSMAAELGLLCFYAPDRYTLGSYANMAFGMASSISVLTALHAEVAGALSRTAGALSAIKRDRESNLMTVEGATGALAHEIRQPMGVIAMEVEAARKNLHRSPPNLEEISGSLDAIDCNALRTNEMIENIRNLLKSDSHPMGVVDLNELVSDAIAKMHDQLESRAVAVKLSLETDLPKIRGHREQLLQVLLNLLRNAIDALDNDTSRNRTVWIETQRQDRDRAMITVRDSGPGIDPGIAGKIFDLFMTTKTSGMGVGLALCRTIVERHGGEIVASSPDGAQFQISLPSF